MEVIEGVALALAVDGGEALDVLREFEPSGTATVVVTHDTASARERGDSATFLGRGIICEVGRTGQLINE